MADKRTFALQSTLPRLPLPTLEETTTKYLQSLLPLATPQQFEQVKQQIQDFLKPDGLGRELQRRLQAHDAASKNSWLEDWWFQMAYLAWPDPIMINSNWFILFTNRPEIIPKQLPARGTFTKEQIGRGADIISCYLDYMTLITREEIPIESSRQGPMCMWQYQQMFGLYRRPGEKGDELVGQFPDCLAARHICILIRDQVYALPVFDEQGKRVKVVEIRKALEKIVARVVFGKEEEQPALGVFTGWNRPGWAKVRQHLITLDKQNASNFEVMEKALFFVALDDYPVGTDTMIGNALNTFHGENAHNRWFDKTMVVCISNDTSAGMNGEHAPCDALIPSYVVEYARAHEPAQDPKTAGEGSLKDATLLKWKVDDFVLKEMVKCEADNKKLIADSDVELIHFSEYGGDFMKSVAKVSPDAYVQMALQLAYYRLHKKCATVYETASTRRFNHGRTETCRSLSLAAKQFVETMDNPNANAQDKLKALQKACADHVKYLGDASNAKGVDRHLLGLQLCLKEGESHPLFKDPLFAASKKWILSTSSLSAGPMFDGTGFGAVVPDGYGMNYMLGPQKIKLGVESKKSCPETSTKKFVQGVQQALRDMHKVASTANQNKL